MSEIDFAKLREVLQNKDSMLELIKLGCEEVINNEREAPESDPKVINVLASCLENQYIRSAEVIYSSAGSEIEKIFLGSLIMFFLKHDPMSFVITGPLNNAHKQIAERRDSFKTIKELQKRTKRNKGNNKTLEATQLK